ncbi:RING finger domain protein [Cordyceps fumosorosea ARSEF 2679]|uniref:RING finger domain protein n=1 Tax=Cordyceps fumosorosea (strain ARSEF 2679) TaxID=1081104 RepID=A0A167MQM9_CORFA|nr:RING finger domain protein [Cordyceps fumosorosea ARSEF 2679]OAA54652.1 RING finger domain protein [Cordyceps fumosorosea ARSEF 2679]
MSSTHSLSKLLSNLSLAPMTPTSVFTTMAINSTTSRAFSASSVSLKRRSADAGRKPTPQHLKPKIGTGKTKASASKRKAKGKPTGQTESGRKVRTLKQNMFSPAPPPLRMARQRHLRHWTIHRAWQLFRRQQHEALHKERSRMQAGMWNACEALRLTEGPGGRDQGYLYRVAMEKKGVWNGDAIPIEYARMQTETPAVQAWNHEWKR